MELVREGRIDSNTLYEAIGLAAKDRGYANTRSIHEHVLRETNQDRAEGITHRLSKAIAGIPERQLGLLLGTPASVGVRRSRKRTNLDEGVPLQ
jgi:hypothetical protein